MRTVRLCPGRRGRPSPSHVSKTFRLPHQQYHTLKERALHPFRARTLRRPARRRRRQRRDRRRRVLRDRRAQRQRQEHAAQVPGRDLRRSTRASSRSAAGCRRSSSSGVGFNPDLTARDNVIINAIMLGLTRKEARERFDDIVAFAELEEFVDLKLKNYSSGMHVRLAFAVAIQVDADILLIDEVLAVGDAAFQQKCFDEFARLQAGRAHDRVRDPRHGRGRALLRPRDAARARPGGRHRRARRRSRGSTTS